MRLFVVTSPATDAGKTFVACNLAAAIAGLGLRVALLDYDLAVGDMVRALGLAEEARRPHPTVASWGDYPDPAAAALRGPGGVAVFPRPENPAEAAAVGEAEAAALLRALSGSFDVAVADAGAEIGSPAWSALVAAADAVLLVLDCDRKALERAASFLSVYGRLLEGKCWLVANRREKASPYSARDVSRFLEGRGFRFAGVAEVPHDGRAAGGALSRKAPAGLKTAGPGTEKALAGLASALLGGALSRPGEAPAGAAIKEEEMGGTGGAPAAGSEGTNGAAGATVTEGKGGRSSRAFWKKLFPGREKGRGAGGDSRGGSAPERPLSPARAGQERPVSSFNGPPAEAPGGLRAQPGDNPGAASAPAPSAVGGAPVGTGGSAAGLEAEKAPPVLFLVGRRAESLLRAAEERGFTPVAGRLPPGVSPDAAIVDTELLPSAGGLGRRVVGLSSGKLSDLLLATGNVPVALNGDAALEIAARFCGLGGATGAPPRAHDTLRVPAGSPGDAAAAPGAPPVAGAVSGFPQHGAPVPAQSATVPRMAATCRRGLVLAFYSGTQAQQGKTSLAVNAAALLAGRGMSVCMVDLDTGKAGLTRLCGYSEERPPGCDLESFFAGCEPAAGPGGTRLVAAPLPEREWFPDPGRAEELVARLAGEYDAVVLDFGVRLVTPPVRAVFRLCDRVFVVTLPHRMSASAVARLRGQWLAEVGAGRVAVVVNRVGYPGMNISPRDAAGLLGFGEFYEVPEDPAVAAAEDEAARGRPYSPPALGRKSRLGRALAVVLDGVMLSSAAGKGVRPC